MIFDLLKNIKGEDDNLLDSYVIHGIDISNYQKNSDIDWDKIGKTQNFCYIKSTEGQDFRDPSFNKHSESCINFEMPFGYYHFATPRKIDAKLEAEDFIKSLDVYVNKWTLPPVLDIEQNKQNLTKSEYNEWCLEFIETVENKFGRKVMVYGSPGLLASFLSSDHGLSKNPVWVAHYTNKPEPRVPIGWPTIDLWQYSDKLMIEGYNKPIDTNRGFLRFFKENFKFN